VVSTASGISLGRVVVLVLIWRRPDALLRPDVGVPSLLDETPALEKAVAERLRILAVVGNDAGLAAHPSGRWTMNCNHFQLAMLAYNLNCWLMLFNREEQAQVETLKHITLATARLRFLFLAAKIWRHAGRIGISYGEHYAEQGLFRRLMDRLRAIASDGLRYGPVLATALIR
jgi:hypothetical protein